LGKTLDFDGSICGLPFASDSHATKGCHGYISGSYSGCIFYGTISGADVISEAQMGNTMNGFYRP
jgi:hypothetical protein